MAINLWQKSIALVFLPPGSNTFLASKHVAEVSTTQLRSTSFAAKEELSWFCWAQEGFLLAPAEDSQVTGVIEAAA